VLNADFTANALYNASPLVCVSAETYTSLSQASSGAERRGFALNLSNYRMQARLHRFTREG
jgi:hypothetical protein